MGGSYNTLTPGNAACRRIIRSKTLDGWVPRVIVRKPRQGDIHPLTRKTIGNYLAHIPIEFIVNLKAVELSPRQGPVGHPPGRYEIDERRIRLYSAPADCWRIAAKRQNIVRFSAYLGAEIEPDGEEIVIRWPDRTALELFYVDVLLHEIGHHYVHLDRRRRKPPGRHADNEFRAELWKSRLWRQIIEGKGITLRSLQARASEDDGTEGDSVPD